MVYVLSLFSLPGAKPQRSYSEGSVEVVCVWLVVFEVDICYNYTQKGKKQGAAFEKKIGTNRHSITITITKGMRTLSLLEGERGFSVVVTS